MVNEEKEDHPFSILLSFHIKGRTLLHLKENHRWGKVLSVVAFLCEELEFLAAFRELLNSVNCIGQSGSYLDGSAPDGLYGIWTGGNSIPSLLPKSGLVPYSFSLCFDNNYSGKIYFRDQEPRIQLSAPLLSYEGK
ncbi:hypothetical protein M9H77_07598 [Catharanthus roseus]|uniref:Uncharacterized protein n=1 Tax=Catharanthus roseus TaxID=4058 RepID=A0ACC0BVS6_CATRO|nr:hypothetical protein M9H77_07598 [Catharanthus roseus]